ncbi:MAG: YvcK family protein [Clostridia bacterium]|nr:YvcK family protein [Clostridia bacterium]MCI9275067.1 YvcK family protein [Clostridia bacterium]
MLGIFKWFKSGTKMKRWMFVILVGIILLCYGIATIMNMQDLSVLKLIMIVFVSIVGFMMVVIGIIYSQKRVLEMLVEDTDERMEKKKEKEDVNVNSLIFDKKVYKEGPKIVVIGGGTGLNTVLKGLKDYTNNLTAIASMTDYGDGQTETNSFMPLEDVSRAIVSLSENEVEMERLLKLKFQDGIDFTNVFVSAMQQINGEGSKFIENISKVLNMTGKILPVTLDKMRICAELEDGTVIDEKDKIADTSMAKISRINRVFISPSNVRPAPGVIEAIEDADAIVIGPRKLIYRSYS